jgi:hypothetical protein
MVGLHLAARVLAVAVAAVVCAALVSSPLPALACCLIAAAAAGALDGLVHGLRRGNGAGRHAPEPVALLLVILGALAYLVAIPITWRALHALADLGHAVGSPWRWLPLVAGAVVFGAGHRMGITRVRGRKRH